MKGLILNNLYSIEGSIKISFLIVILINILPFFTDNPTVFNLAIMLSLILIPVNAFSQLKQDSSAGWDKFETTLPVERYKIIQSKYLTFLLLVIISSFLTVTLTYISSLFLPFNEWSFFNFFPRGIGLVICLASLTFPLTYILGADKSELIMILSMVFSLGMFGVVYILQNKIVGRIVDEFFSLTFLFVSICLFIISFVLSNIIYIKKEF